ncbi:MAG: DUF1385 domain-containing protein [Bryobacteraceae bacterium]
MSVRGFLRLFAHLQLLPILESGEETLVGGQAVMEGVMMRSPHSYCVAVRKPDGEIVTEESQLARMSEKHKIFKLPVIRGLGTLGQAMWLGMRALRFSANALLDSAGSEPGSEPKAKKRELSGWAMWGNVAFSLLFFLFLYKVVPLFLATWLGHHIPGAGSRLAINLIDGVIRIALFLGFLVAISRMKDIERVFEYHGAEHKVVFNFESGQPVTVENAQRFVTWHPRCGTSFLLVVMVLAMIVYALLPFDSFAVKLAARIALLPLIAGLSYELIRYAARRRKGLMAMLTQPGLWLQRITTQPPSNDQAEVAIHALDRAMALEKAQGGELVIA